MKPVWLRCKLPDLPSIQKMRGLLRNHNLNTVCEEALCPNQGECFSRGTATFLILGRTCTRSCAFCAIPTDKLPPTPDPQEPERIARVAAHLGLRHVVVTSVTRDDLVDGGAAQFAVTVKTLKQRCPQIIVEVLIPDLQGQAAALETVMQSRPDIINHNLETVPRLYPGVRPQADYRRSVRLLRMVKEIDPGKITKSGLMLGLGEEREEILAVMTDLRAASCDLLTLGQYLQPSERHHPVVRYATPEEFTELGRRGEKMGFRAVFAAPLVRSSLHAADVFAKIVAEQRTHLRDENPLSAVTVDA
jgi:lipoyl synthase